jgi:predicted peroxiredoxin
MNAVHGLPKKKDKKIMGEKYPQNITPLKMQEKEGKRFYVC